MRSSARSTSQSKARANPRSPVRRGFVAVSDDRGRVGFQPWDSFDLHGPVGNDQYWRSRRGIVTRCDRCGSGLSHLEFRGDHMYCRVCGQEAADFHVAPVRKRNPFERVESLTKRLVDQFSNSGMIPTKLLQEVCGEYWKVGMPVTTAQLREVAAHLLTQAERNQ